MRSPAPRANAGNRAEVVRNETSLYHRPPEPEADFAALYLARRFGLAMPLAHVVAALANLGGRSDERRPRLRRDQSSGSGGLPCRAEQASAGRQSRRREIVALNPRRADRNLGTFKINRYNGRWCDFATGDKGGDPISLVAYLADVSQGEAARLLAQMLGHGNRGARAMDDALDLRASDRCRDRGRGARKLERNAEAGRAEADMPARRRGNRRAGGGAAVWSRARWTMALCDGGRRNRLLCLPLE